MSIKWHESSKLGISNLQLIIFLMLLMCCSILPGDIIVPSLPKIGPSINANDNQIQLLVSIFFYAASFFQTIWGFIIHKVGPKRSLLSGICIFIIGCFLSAKSPNVYVLWFSRFLQGIGTATFIIIPRYYLKMCYPKPKQMGQISAYMTMCIGITLGLSPLIGGYVHSHFGWRWNFWFLLTIGSLLFMLFYSKMPNKLLASHGKPRFAYLKDDLLNRPFILFTILTGLTLSFALTYYTMSPFILQNLLHYTPEQVGFFGALSCIPVFVGGISVRHIMKKNGASTVFITAFSILTLSSGWMLTNALLDNLSIWTTVAPFFTACLGTSMLFPTCFIQASQHIRHTATGTGLYGSCQNFIAAFITGLCAMVHEESALPMSIIMFSIVTAAMLVFIASEKLRSKK